MLMPKTTANPMSDYLTAKQIADEYGVRREHVTLLIRRGKIQAIRPGHEYLVLRSEWERYEGEKEPRGARRGPRKRDKKN